MRRFKLGVLGKILVVAAAVAVIGGAGYMAFGSGLIKDSTPEHTQDWLETDYRCEHGIKNTARLYLWKIGTGCKH